METPEKQAITVQQLDALCKEIADQRNTCDEYEAKATEQNKTLAALEAKAVEYLEALEREKYQSEYGTISIKENWRVNLPDSPDNWSKLFGYFRERECFDGMITVNSNKLNSFYKEEQKIAEEEGRVMEFAIPGLNPPKLHRSLAYRKAK